MDDESNDLEATGSATKQMRAVKQTLAIDKARDEVRAEYEKKLEAKEEEERKHITSSVYSQRARIKKLEDEMIKVKQTLAIVKWLGMTLGGLVLTGLAAAIFGG